MIILFTCYCVPAAVHATDEAVLDRVGHRSGLDLHSDLPKISNDKPADGAVRRTYTERQSVGVEIVAVDHDRNETAGDVSGLSCPVDDDLIGDRGQCRSNVDHLRATAGDAERYRVDTRIGIGIQNCLPERACSAVVRIGDGISRQNKVGVSLELIAESHVCRDRANLVFQIPVRVASSPAGGVIARRGIAIRQRTDLIQ